jgi:hypothetical protein
MDSQRVKLYVWRFFYEGRWLNKFQDVLDVYTGSWSRILPSGDPGSTGEETYPTPREGAASFSYDRALVGSARNGLSDTVVSFHINILTSLLNLSFPRSLVAGTHPGNTSRTCGS